MAADIEFSVPVQPDVDEIGGDIVHQRPFAGGVGDDQRDVMLAEQRNKFGALEGFVAELDRVAQRAIPVGFGPAAVFQMVVVPAGEGRGAFCVVRQDFKKAARRSGLKLKHTAPRSVI